MELKIAMDENSSEDVVERGLYHVGKKYFAAEHVCTTEDN
jgi:hypothetical protein